MKAASMIGQAAVIGLFGGAVWAATPPASTMSPDEREHDRVERSVTYGGCHEVRALGKAPLLAGQPGYRETMDGDHDGIACEPIRSRKPLPRRRTG